MKQDAVLNGGKNLFRKRQIFTPDRGWLALSDQSQGRAGMFHCPSLLLGARSGLPWPLCTLCSGPRGAGQGTPHMGEARALCPMSLPVYRQFPGTEGGGEWGGVALVIPAVPPTPLPGGTGGGVHTPATLRPPGS